MKILLSHNFYQLPGGEDQVYFDEGNLLESHGHQVIRFEKHNDEIKSMSRREVACKTIRNHQVERQLGDLIAAEKPDIVHFHNTFPLISIAGYQAAHQANVPVIQTLHNFRLLCPSSNFLRKGKVCQLCASRRFAWPAIVNACYQKNALATAVVAIDNFWNRNRKLDLVDRFIVLTNHSKQVFQQYGFPAEKLVIKPNFVRTEIGPQIETEDYVIFVGRLSEEKGVKVMLEAWQQLQNPVPLVIVGTGPLSDLVQQASRQSPNIQSYGQLPFEQTLDKIKRARFLLMPSVCFETFGRSTIEAFAMGIPVVASNIGATAEIVTDGKTGLLFKPGDSKDCAAKVERLYADANLCNRMGTEAQQEFFDRYSPETNYRMLIDIYEGALSGSLKSGSSKVGSMIH